VISVDERTRAALIDSMYQTRGDAESWHTTRRDNNG